MAARSSGQVMSAMLIVLGSGAVSGRLTAKMAIAAPASTLATALAADHRPLLVAPDGVLRACQRRRRRAKRSGIWSPVSSRQETLLARCPFDSLNALPKR